jgi:hypothetical protein
MKIEEVKIDQLVRIKKQENQKYSHIYRVHSFDASMVRIERIESSSLRKALWKLDYTPPFNQLTPELPTDKGLMNIADRIMEAIDAECKKYLPDFDWEMTAFEQYEVSPEDLILMEYR